MTIAQHRKKTRFILELRYEAMPQFIDARGGLVATLLPTVKAEFPHWQVEPGQILFADGGEKPKNQIVLGTKRSLVIVEDGASLESFVTLAENVLQLAFPVMAAGWRVIDRIGVRFIEVARSPKPTYDSLRSHIVSTFHKTPLGLPLEHTDSQSVMVHKYGRYAIGPTKKKDDWLSTVFGAPDHGVPDIGVAIDVDSFVNGTKAHSIEALISGIRGVLSLTETVEEALFAAAGIVDG